MGDGRSAISLLSPTVESFPHDPHYQRGAEGIGNTISIRALFKSLKENSTQLPWFSIK